jgi:hypothetical protein
MVSESQLSRQGKGRKHIHIRNDLMRRPCAPQQRGSVRCGTKLDGQVRAADVKLSASPTSLRQRTPDTCLCIASRQCMWCSEQTLASLPRIVHPLHSASVA